MTKKLSKKSSILIVALVAAISFVLLYVYSNQTTPRADDFRSFANLSKMSDDGAGLRRCLDRHRINHRDVDGQIEIPKESERKAVERCS